MTLLATRSTALQASFRAQPFNSSYDFMFIAASAGIAVASGLLLYFAHREPTWDSGDATTLLPTSWSWWNAFDMFETFGCAALAFANLLAGAIGAAAAWFIALVVLGAQPRTRRSELDSFGTPCVYRSAVRGLPGRTVSERTA